MNERFRCLFLNYDAGTHSMLRSYLRRGGYQEIFLVTGSHFTAQFEPDSLTGTDLIFLHLASPEESLSETIALQLEQHPGVVITSPFPKQQFEHLRTQPFDFLNEPFSFLRFTQCIKRYQQMSKQQDHQGDRSTSNG